MNWWRLFRLRWRVADLQAMVEAAHLDVQDAELRRTVLLRELRKARDQLACVQRWARFQSIAGGKL